MDVRCGHRARVLASLKRANAPVNEEFKLKFQHGWVTALQATTCSDDIRDARPSNMPRCIADAADATPVTSLIPATPQTYVASYCAARKNNVHAALLYKCQMKQDDAMLSASTPMYFHTHRHLFLAKIPVKRNFKTTVQEIRTCRRMDVLMAFCQSALGMLRH